MFSNRTCIFDIWREDHLSSGCICFRPLHWQNTSPMSETLLKLHLTLQCTGWGIRQSHSQQSLKITKYSINATLCIFVFRIFWIRNLRLSRLMEHMGCLLDTHDWPQKWPTFVADDLESKTRIPPFPISLVLLSLTRQDSGDCQRQGWVGGGERVRLRAEPLLP